MLFAAYFLEAGLILIVAPWSGFWDRNFFVEMVPAVEALLASPFARGAVSGVGVVTVLAGIAEVSGAFAARRDAAPTSRSAGLPSDAE